MYQSPITVFEREFENHIEDGIYKAVKGFTIDVNKEELLKALQYDRGQYSKGYSDGYSKAIEEFADRLVSETEWYSPGGYAIPAIKIRIIARELKGE